MSVLEKLNVNKRSVYLHLIKNHEYQDHPMSWHFWKLYAWPTYSAMLEELIRTTKNSEEALSFFSDALSDQKESADKIQNERKEMIKNSTGLSWDEVEKRLE